MEGTLRAAGTVVRLNVRLVDATTNAHLWAETYERSLESGQFALQDDLAARVVATVADTNGVLVRSLASSLNDRDPDELPLDYAEPNMEKVIILLTDGNNEWYDYPGISWNPTPNPPTENHFSGIPGDNAYPGTNGTTFKNTWPGADYTAYGRLSEGRLGTTNKGTANSILDDRMLDMCQTMKAQGILIYTMTFGPSPDTGTKQLYLDCATKPDMYYHAPTGSALQQAFVTIADELSKLRIAE